MGRVVIGMDPHKRSATIEVLDADEHQSRHLLRRQAGALSTEVEVSAVNTIEQCPSMSCCTTRRSTPAASASVAAPCRRSCSRIGGNPASAVRPSRPRLGRAAPDGTAERTAREGAAAGIRVGVKARIRTPPADVRR